MLSLSPNVSLLALVFLFFYIRPTLAFGAGNVASISKIEGENWRHGDIEDVLLTILLARRMGGKKFDKLDVARVYFGNWLRDYSQAIDVGTVKAVSAEAIRLLLSILGFMTFGYGSKEFEVTADRLGCYRPEDHIDNPKNYADNVDARQYDRRLRGPINERVELAIDPETGMKNYIANEGLRIMSSAKHVRNLFSRCIELGRSSRDNDPDFCEALRLLGTGLHCLEDFFAHSNYTELALIEMGERDVFPHVGRDTRISIPGARRDVYPLVTGTFGGVDFLHSVTGEVSDKLTQNEIEELEQTLQHGNNNSSSALADILDKIPDGMLGGDKDGKKGKMHEIEENAHNSQMENATITPRDPEQLTEYCQQVFRQIMPAIQFHDDLMKGITEAVENIPILPGVLEKFGEGMTMWVFSIMAPFVVPIIQQVKSELSTGSNEIIESSQREQHIVFHDDSSTDPTHSMLSKDHFSNILNEIAGKTASKVVAWVVPQIMEAWDDEGVDVDRLLNRIISGVLHHPAQRDQGEDGADEGRRIMFSSVEDWWNNMDDGAKDEYREKLSRDGVENGQNHKEGVHDSGHGCGKPLNANNPFAKGGTLEERIATKIAGTLLDGVTGGLSDVVKANTGFSLKGTNQSRQESGGGGGIGGFLSSFLGGGGGSSNQEESSYSRREESSYSRDDDSQSYSRHERREERRDDGGGYGYEQRTETRREYGGGYEERTERYESRQEYSSGSYGESRQESYGGGYSSSRRDDEGGYGRRRDEDEGYNRRDDNESYGRRNEDEGYGRRRDDDEYQSRNEGYGRRRDEDEGYGRRQDQDEGYGRRDNEYGGGYDGGNDYGRRRRDEDGEGEGRRGWGY